MSIKKGSFFSVNPQNQLTLKTPNQKPKILKGKFSVGGDNALIYQITDSNKWYRKYNIPDRVEFQGKWQLDKNHNLVLNIKKKEGIKEGSLVLKGDIINQEGDYFVFKIKSKISSGITRFSYLKLKGQWRADKFNRITFEVTKKAEPDTLIFKGIWDVNKYQKITYVHEKENLKTKRKTSQSIEFEGFWQINERNRLVYILSHARDSKFDFRAHLQSTSLYPAKGKIKYRLGIGVKGERKEKIITLYGEWKFSRNLGLSFMMNYGKNNIQRISFGAYVNLDKHNKLRFSLINNDGESLGLALEFSHKWLVKKDAQTFLRLKRILEKETAIEAGVRLPF